MIDKSNLPELQDIYQSNKWAKGNITRTTKQFCMDNNIVYTDSLRRIVSLLFQKYEDELDLQTQESTPAKILVYDIETSPLLSYVWGAWNQNIGYNMDQLVDEWFVLTWSAKWLFDDKIMSDKLNQQELLEQDDLRIVKSLWELMNEADIVIAHNALKFDNKRMNTRYLKNELVPPLPYQTIDTLAHARKTFAVTSNRLDYLAKYLGIEGKMETEGIKLWKRCMQGDAEAIDIMEKYNIQDVKVLEEVYLRLRPFIKPHPNMGLHIAEDVECCPTCASTNIELKGTYYTYANAYNAFRCGNCGSVGRSRKSIISAKDKRNMLISIPK